MSIKAKEIGLPLLTFVAGCVFSVIVQHAIEKRVLSSAATNLALIIILLVCLGYVFQSNFSAVEESSRGNFQEIKQLIAQLMAKAADIDSRIGVKVKYIEREGSEGQAIVFRELRAVIEKAEKRIIIVNAANKISIGEISDDKKLYYDSLLGRVRERGVEYWRIIQAEAETIQDLTADPEYLQHFHEMIDEKANSRSLVHLDKVSASRPLTFTLVDDNWLMLQLDEKTSNGLRIHGVFIFEDPQRIVISHFYKFYQEIIANSLGAIQRSELPPLKER